MCNCCESSLRFFTCSAVFVISAVVLLMIATIETSKFGPHNNQLALRLNSLTFNNLSVSGEREKVLVTSWRADFLVKVNRTNLTIRISPFYAFITFRDQVLSNGIMDDALYLGNGTGRGVTFHVKDDPRHYYEKVFMESRHREAFLEELQGRSLRMNMNMVFDAYYQHGSWGWQVQLRPYCKELIVLQKDIHLPWSLAGPVDCVIPVPSRGYI